MGAAQSTRKITLVDDDKAGVIKLSESLAHRLRGQLEGQHVATAQSASPAAAQEPMHSTSPPQAPLPPTPKPSFAEKPLVIVPEPPRVPDVAPPPESPKVLAEVLPESTESISKGLPRKVTPEPLVPQPPPSLDNVVKQMPPPGTVPLLPHIGGPPPIQSSVTETTVAPDIGIAVRAGPSPTLAKPGGNIPPWSIYAEEAHLMVIRLRDEKEQEIKKVNQEWRDRMDAREQEFVKMAHLSEDQVASALKEVESLFMKASCTPVCQDQQDSVMKCYQDHPRQSLRCAREVEHFTQCVDLSRLQSIMKQEAH